jgi:predicted alpha/beta-hydrolase family hydrolase
MSAAGLLLFHGAGGHRDHRVFLALEAALSVEPVVPVRRIDFAYRAKGPRQPPSRVPGLITEVIDAATAWAEELGVGTDRLVLGGRSLGGRVASMAIAEGFPAAGLVLLSYPLHPPGKPEKLRIEHLPAVAVPTIAVSGDRDPFGRPDELAAHLAAIAGPTELVALPGDGHDPKKNDDLLVRSVTDWVRSLS